MDEKVDYWLALCDDDLNTAKALWKSNRLLHMGIFCHMIVERSLKAVVTGRTGEIPHGIHDLQKLAARGGILDNLSEEQFALMDRLTSLRIEARNPEHNERISGTLTVEYCAHLLADTEAFLCWIKQQPGK